MATRIYLPSSGAAPITPAYSASWYGAASARLGRILASLAHGATAQTTASHDDNSSAARTFYFGQWISPPLTAQTIHAQTVGVSIKVSETSTSNLNYLYWIIRVVQSDGVTYRGTLVGYNADDNVAPTTIASRYDSATSSELAVSLGDRIVIEVGMGGDPPGGGNHDTSMIFGDDATNDLAASDGDTDIDNCWIDFGTDTISFLTTSTITATKTIRARMKKIGITLTETTRARIKQQEVTKKETSRARIKWSGVTKTETTKARMKQAGTTKKETSRARIKKETVAKQTSRAAIRQTGVTRKETSRARIKGTVLSLLAPRGRLIQTPTKGFSIKARIVSAITKGVRARIKIAGISNLLSMKANIYSAIQTYTKMWQVRARLKQSGITITETSRGRIKQSGVAKTETSRATIKQFGFSRYETSRADIKKFGVSKLEQLKARIKQTGISKLLSERARIKTTPTLKIQSKARMKRIGLSKLETSKARLKRIGITNLETARARLKATQSKLETLKARLKNTQNKIMTSRNRIKIVGITKKETLRARIKSTGNKLIQLRAHLKATQNNILTAKGKILISGGKNILMRGVIKQFGISKLEQSRARIKNIGITKIYQTKARITSPGKYFFIQSKGRIKIIGISKQLAEKGRIKQLGISNLLSEKGRIEQEGRTKRISLKSRILGTKLRLFSSRAMIETVKEVMVSVKAKIEHEISKTIQARVRIKRLGKENNLSSRADIKTFGMLKNLLMMACIKVGIYATTCFPYSQMTGIYQSKTGIYSSKNGIYNKIITKCS